MDERRKVKRKDFSYYMRLFDSDTQILVGHLADISTGGFKIDSREPIDVDKIFRLRMDLFPEVSSKPYMIFTARSRWCQVHPLDPTLYHIGFQIVSIQPGDYEILNRLVQNYASDKRSSGFGTGW
jgi:hypothetical protein